MMLIQRNHKLHPLCYISVKHWLASQNVPKQASLLPERIIARVKDTCKTSMTKQWYLDKVQSDSTNNINRIQQ